MGENFGGLLDVVARRRPDAAAILWDDGALSWREIELRAGGVARRLSRQGVRAGDTVALQLPNGWEFVAAVWGALKVGAVVCPINPLLSGEERRKVLEHLDPALVVEEVREEEAVWRDIEAGIEPVARDRRGRVVRISDLWGRGGRFRVHGVVSPGSAASANVKQRVSLPSCVGKNKPRATSGKGGA